VQAGSLEFVMVRVVVQLCFFLAPPASVYCAHSLTALAPKPLLLASPPPPNKHPKTNRQNNGSGDWDAPGRYTEAPGNYKITKPGTYKLKSGRLERLSD
jgi:hypothetical protein